MKHAIRTSGLGKIYRAGFWMRPVVGLEDLDLEVQPGEAFGFVGPNGAGKTTTIKILVGLHCSTSGEAWILGRPHSDPGTRREVGFLPERPYFYVHLSARELLDFYGQLFELDKATRKRRIEELLERVDLRRFADVPLGKYSKGMLQRVGLCQALIHEPSLLILDEPMSGLDPLGRGLVRDLILAERARGTTVFFSSHILSDVEAICDRVAILVQGRLRGVGTVEELVGGRVRHVDCCFEGAERMPLDGAQVLRVDGGRTQVRVEPGEVDALLVRLQAAGGRVVSVIPVQESLEQVLLDEVERASPVDAKRIGVLS